MLSCDDAFNLDPCISELFRSETKFFFQGYLLILLASRCNSCLLGAYRRRWIEISILMAWSLNVYGSYEVPRGEMQTMQLKFEFISVH
jgi:hypothetical protein